MSMSAEVTIRVDPIGRIVAPYTIARRYTYWLLRDGLCIKTGSGWGYEGAYNAAVKAKRRLLAAT